MSRRTAYYAGVRTALVTPDVVSAGKGMTFVQVTTIMTVVPYDSPVVFRLTKNGITTAWPRVRNTKRNNFPCDTIIRCDP